MPVHSGSAAVSASLKCLLLVAIVGRPGSDAIFCFVIRKRFLNLSGRSRAADQTLASETSIPLCLECGIPDRLTSEGWVSPCVGSCRSASIRRALSAPIAASAALGRY